MQRVELEKSFHLVLQTFRNDQNCEKNVCLLFITVFIFLKTCEEFKAFKLLNMPNMSYTCHRKRSMFFGWLKGLDRQLLEKAYLENIK